MRLHHKRFFKEAVLAGAHPPKPSRLWCYGLLPLREALSWTFRPPNPQALHDILEGECPELSVQGPNSPTMHVRERILNPATDGTLLQRLVGVQAKDMRGFNRVMNLQQRYLFRLLAKNCPTVGPAQSPHQTRFLEIQ